MRHITIMDVPFLFTTQKAFSSLLAERIEKKLKTFVITANPEIVMMAKENPSIKENVKRATYVVADGIGIIKASQILKDPLPERVTGYDTMLQLLSIADKRSYRIFLLGAQPETLEKTEDALNKRYPSIQIVGRHHGFFDMTSKHVTDQIMEASPDITFVALGAPRQEEWIARNLSTLPNGLYIGVGGSFDVIAGTVKRAPIIFQKLNLEWFYRLVKQPSRWRRMLALPRFAVHILKVKFTRNPL